MSNSGKTVAVDRHTVTRGRQCRSCEARIAWCVVTASNRRMPFDEPLHIVSEDADTLHVDLATSHFATCPHAAQWKRRKGDPDGQQQ